MIMGYTHYFPQNKVPTAEQWQALTAAFDVLYANTSVPIQWESDDDSAPESGPDCICFNGVGGDGHETFILERDNTSFNFCKTAHKPYDLVVCATLILADYYCPGCYVISSDGDAADWMVALQHVRINLEDVELPSAV
jgi:hypothetical protein